jgi:hypothetical protein
MNRFTFLIVVIAATLTLPAGAIACERASAKVVIAEPESGAVVVAVSSLPEVAQGIAEWIELPELRNEIAEIAQVKAVSFGNGVCVSGEGEACRAGVFLTVAKALGKAALRGIAAVIDGMV